MNLLTINPTILALTTGSVAILAMTLAALASAFWLLSRAARGLPAAASAPTANDMATIRNELLQNYERLRRSSEALPLAVAAWQRLRSRTELMPPEVRTRIAQAYSAIEVSNSLLRAAEAYDSRGHLSLRQRRLTLWPTLETAVRTALETLGTSPTPAVQACLRWVATADAPLAPAVRSTVLHPHELPKLALVPGKLLHQPAALEPAHSKVQKKSPRLRRDSDGQMPLWESVA